MSSDPSKAGPIIAKPVSVRTAVLVVIACTVVFVAGPLYLYRQIEASFDQYSRTHSELLPTAGVNRWGFNFKPLLIKREDLMIGKLPRKDDVPVLMNPANCPANEAVVGPDEHVVGVTIGGESRAYPLSILNWHTLVNDTLGGEPIAVTYGGMSGTVSGFSRRVAGETLVFGMSGLLYKSNMIMFDRRVNPNQESLWSQLLMQAVAGPAAAQARRLEPIDCDVLPWSEWSRLHPDTTIMLPYTNYPISYTSAWLYIPRGYLEHKQLEQEGPLVELEPVESKRDLRANRKDLEWQSPVVLVSGPKSSRAYPFKDVMDQKDGIKGELDGVHYRLYKSGGKVPCVIMETDRPGLTRSYLAWFVWTAME